ncbi:unnamed protein product [Thlaspi arvense]|uniref:DUF1216 domain-containing protein n=1 Tax=Thlaspi arvense TaxID=13288 RepID=A0AAU9RN99_THLAR|nr:unnamed protein product [Thlaspi arvense]
MARISLAVCLMLLVALSDVYETQSQGTFLLRDYLQLFPKMSKDFEPYASKGLLDFVGVLEGKSPTTVEFKSFFTKLKDYISDRFNPASSGPLGSQKSEQLFMAMSALKGTKDGSSFDSWRLIEALVSMEKVSVEMKKSTPSEITSPRWERLYGSMNEWVTRIGLYVKKVSEINGKLIDLSQFEIDYVDPTYTSLSKEVSSTTQASFSLPIYLGNFPRIGKDFEPFAYKGMLDFASDLETKCLANAEFKDFFVKLNEYMAGFKTESPETYSIESTNITYKAMKLFVASSALSGTKVGTSDPWRLVDGLLSMGQVLVEMKKSGSNAITFEQKRELTWAMVKWARAVSQFVKTASEKRGVTMDLSSFESYYNSHVLVPAQA